MSSFEIRNLLGLRDGKRIYVIDSNHVSKEEYDYCLVLNNVLWGGGGRFNMASALAGNAVSSAPGEKAGFDPKSLGSLSGPRTASYIADHQGLKLNADSNQS